MQEWATAPLCLAPILVQYHRQIALQPYLTCVFICYCHIFHPSTMEVGYLDLFENMGLGKVVTTTQTKMLLI